MIPLLLITGGLVGLGGGPMSLAAGGALHLLKIPIAIYSVDHNLKKKKDLQSLIKREEEEILEIVSFIAKRIL
jgi:hypothetical protein